MAEASNRKDEPMRFPNPFAWLAGKMVRPEARQEATEIGSMPSIPTPSPADRPDTSIITPDQVEDLDPNVRSVLAECFNSGGTVFGEVDEYGNLRMTDERGNAIMVISDPSGSDCRHAASPPPLSLKITTDYPIF